MTTSTQESTAGGLTWRRCALIVAAALVVGVGLSWLLLPVWLVPPYMKYTPYVHLCLTAAWVPVLAICALRRPQGKISVPILIALLGLLASVFWCALIGPAVSIASAEGGISGSVTCESEPLPGGRVRYVCAVTYSDASEVIVLEGRSGLPFARLVGTRVDGS